MKNLKFIHLNLYNNQTVQDFSGIYIFHNITKDKYYVGQSHNVPNRLNTYFTKQSHNKKLTEDLFTDDFELATLNLDQLLDLLQVTSLNQAESFFIQKFNSNFPAFGYNKTSGNSSKPVKFVFYNSTNPIENPEFDSVRANETIERKDKLFTQYLYDTYPKLLTNKQLPKPLLKALFDDYSQDSNHKIGNSLAFTNFYKDELSSLRFNKSNKKYYNADDILMLLTDDIEKLRSALNADSEKNPYLVNFLASFNGSIKQLRICEKTFF